MSDHRLFKTTPFPLTIKLTRATVVRAVEGFSYMAAVPAWSRSSETPSRITICKAADRAEAFRSQEEGRYCRAISSGAILFTTTEAELLLTTYLLRLRSPKMS